MWLCAGDWAGLGPVLVLVAGAGCTVLADPAHELLLTMIAALLLLWVQMTRSIPSWRHGDTALLNTQQPHSHFISPSPSQALRSVPCPKPSQLSNSLNAQGRRQNTIWITLISQSSSGKLNKLQTLGFGFTLLSECI